MIRRRVIFSGRVQGVGFRATARHIAQRFEVTGFVKNLAGGDVELVAEGDAMELGQFLATIASEMSRNITDQQVSEQRATREFIAFEISY